MPNLKRKIAFYTIQRRRRDFVERVPKDTSLDWAQLLLEFSQKTWTERHNDSTFYSVDMTKRFPILEIAESLDMKFLAQLDEEHQKVSDLADAGIADGKLKLAQMSAVLFYPKHDIVAFVTGSGRPAVRIVDVFLNTYMHADSFEWELTPLFTPSGLEEFKENMVGVQRFETRFSTQRELLSTEHSPNPIQGFADNVADGIGADVNITISVSIPTAAKTLSASKKLKQLLLKAVPFIAQQDKRIEVRGTTVGNILTDLNLLAHPLTHTADLTNTVQPRQFSQLVDTLVDVCGEKENEVYELAER
jgi:hypothetical protein